MKQIHTSGNTLEHLEVYVPEKIKTLVVALLIGFSLVYIVGLSSPMPIHNAAHDTRHAAGFPCH